MAHAKKPLPTVTALAELGKQHFSSHFEPDLWMRTGGSPWEAFTGRTFYPGMTQDVAELGTRLRESLSEKEHWDEPVSYSKLVREFSDAPSGGRLSHDITKENCLRQVLTTLTAAGALRGEMVKTSLKVVGSDGPGPMPTGRRLRLFFIDPWYSKDTWDHCMKRYGSRSRVDEDADVLDF